jgi:hypothetical protein
MTNPDSRFPGKTLVFGVGFILIGIVLLLYTAGFIIGPVSLWPLAPIMVGGFLLYRAFIGNGPESYVFIGIFVGLGGVVMLLLNTVITGFELSRIWPVFMTIIGISLYGYGRQKADVYNRMTYVIPSITIVVLSFLFLLFSLKIIETEFRSFVWTWWPILFIGFGVVLMALHFSRSR